MDFDSIEMDAEYLDVIDSRTVWTDSAIKCLLAFMAENHNNVGKTFALKNKTKLWQRAAENLQAANFLFTPGQVETKFRGLERLYKKKKLNLKLTGRSPMSYPYEKEMEEIMRDKKGVNPDFTLEVDSGQTMEFPSAQLDSSESSCGATPQRKERSSTQEKLLNILQELKEEKKKKAEEGKRQHNELMEFLREREKTKAESEKKKLEMIQKLLEK